MARRNYNARQRRRAARSFAPSRSRRLARATFREDEEEIEEEIEDTADEDDLDEDDLATPIADATLAWDEEAHQEAWQQVDALADRDSDAAVYLQQVALYQRERGRPLDDADEDTDADADDLPDAEARPLSRKRPLRLPARPDAFDVMRFFDALAAEYNWTDAEIRATPWKSLLGYAREAELRHEREQRAYRNAQRGNGSTRGYGEDDLDRDDDLDTRVDRDAARVSRLLARDKPVIWPRGA